jgi:hypothetical protein
MRYFNFRRLSILDLKFLTSFVFKITVSRFHSDGGVTSSTDFSQHSSFRGIHVDVSCVMTDRRLTTRRS